MLSDREKIKSFFGLFFRRVVLHYAQPLSLPPTFPLQRDAVHINERFLERQRLAGGHTQPTWQVTLCRQWEKDFGLPDGCLLPGSAERNFAEQTRVRERKSTNATTEEASIRTARLRRKKRAEAQVAKAAKDDDGCRSGMTDVGGGGAKSKSRSKSTKTPKTPQKICPKCGYHGHTTTRSAKCWYNETALKWLWPGPDNPRPPPEGQSHPPPRGVDPWRVRGVDEQDVAPDLRFDGTAIHEAEGSNSALVGKGSASKPKRKRAQKKKNDTKASLAVVLTATPAVSLPPPDTLDWSL